MTYTPQADYNGDATFTYRIADPHGSGATGTVTVAVRAVNDAPIALADARATKVDAVLSFPAFELPANDAAGPADEAGQQLQVTEVAATGETRGSVAMLLGNVVYTPPQGFFGTDRFAYTVCDDGTTGGRPRSALRFGRRHGRHRGAACARGLGPCPCDRRGRGAEADAVGQRR